MFWVPAIGFLRPTRAKALCCGPAGGGAGWGSPLLQRGSGGIIPGKFLKICFQNPAFWCHERQKCWSLLV